MPKKKRGSDLEIWKTNRPEAKPGKLRIVGGKHRGRQLAYSGDPRTRPMKDNIREALFNLVGGFMQDKQVFDLFAGTGAMGLESISRGAVHATMIERHFPSAKIIEKNIAELESESVTTVITSDTFFWSRKFLAPNNQRPSQPWAVFCCPPYDMYISHEEPLMTMLTGLMEQAPGDSLFVVESDSRFNPERLPSPDGWKVRQYAPALISVFRT